MHYISACIKLELLFQLTPECPINNHLFELCKLILCFLRQSSHCEHLSFFSPHFIAFTPPFSTLFLIFPSPLFTLFHLYGFFLLLCISINNYSFNFRNFSRSDFFYSSLYRKLRMRAEDRLCDIAYFSALLLPANKKAQPPPWRLRFYAKYARAKSDSLTSLFLLRSCCTDRPISRTGQIRYLS